MELRQVCGFPISVLFLFVMLGVEPRLLCVLHNMPSSCFILTQSLVQLLLPFQTQFRFPFNLALLSVSFLTSFSTGPIQPCVLWSTPGLFPLSKSHIKLCFLPFWGLDCKDPVSLIPVTPIIINKAVHTFGS